MSIYNIIIGLVLSDDYSKQISMIINFYITTFKIINLQNR